jgi:hypothetical protein
MFSEKNELMNMNSFRICLAIILLFFLSTCKKENRCDCLKGTGKITRQERKVPHVRYFNFGKGKMTCYITNDSVFKVEVQAGSNLINLVKTEIKNDTLFLSNNNICNFVRSYKPDINIYISTPDPKAIIQKGVSIIRSTNTIKADSLLVETWSTGDITLDVDCNYFKSHLHEGTALYARGTAKYHTSSMWHNSTFFGEQLITTGTYVYHNTTGNFYCNVSDNLTANMAFSGNIIYSGNPQLHVTKSGTGQVIKK